MSQERKEEVLKHTQKHRAPPARRRKPLFRVKRKGKKNPVPSARVGKKKKGKSKKTLWRIYQEEGVSNSTGKNPRSKRNWMLECERARKPTGKKER